MTVREIYELINSIAPYETQASFDNSGLTLGDPEHEVRGILLALDVCDAVIDEAEAIGADLIVTHHPVLLEGVRSLREDDREGHLILRMIRSGIAMISAHTNLDQAAGGINDVLAEACGLTEISGEGYVRVGTLPEGTTAGSLPQMIAERLDTVVRVMGQLPAEKPLSRMMVSSGAGSGSWQHAAEMGAQVFLSGEIKHHHALELCSRGILPLECGHYATEAPGIFALAKALQTYANHVQWKGTVSTSRAGAYTMRVSDAGH